MGCWRRLLRVPWIASRSNQSIIKEISPECSLEGQMLKLKLQYFDHLMRRTDPLETTLMLGKIERRRKTGWQRMRWLGAITDSVDMSLSKLRVLVRTGKPGVLLSVGSQRVRHDWAPELNWTQRFTFSFHCIRAQGQVHMHCLGSWVKSKVRNQEVKVPSLVSRFHFLVRVGVRFQCQTKVLFKFPCQCSYQGSRVKAQVSYGRS